MTGSNSRKRLTVIASAEGIDRAKKALIRLGFESKAKFAEVQLLSRHSVTKFFGKQPIQFDTFKRVCEGLNLDWNEILDSESNAAVGQQEKSGLLEPVVEMNIALTKQNLGTTPAITRQITVLDSQKVAKKTLILRGDIHSVDSTFRAVLEILLKEYGGDTIEILDIQAGSIRVTIQGSEQDVERLRERIVSGELAQINGCPIEDFVILGDESDESPELDTPKSPSLQTKWDLIQSIKSQPQPSRYLRGSDLSEADLRGADLRRADLRGAFLNRANLRRANLNEVNLHEAELRLSYLNEAGLRRANLREADLRRANLREADLYGANLNLSYLNEANLREADLSEANLCGADLRGAFLNRANLHGATVQDAQFGEGKGLSREEKQDLARRGAIFDDASGDRGSAYFPVNR